MIIKCHHCNKEVVPGKSFCLYHLEKKRVQMKQRRAKAKLSGMCQHCCTKPAVPGKTKCHQCCEKNKIAIKKDRERLNSKGICHVCRKNPIMPGRTRCANCTQFDYGDKKKNRGKAYTRDNGICQICGKTGFMYIHHIDGSNHHEVVPQVNHDLNNLVTLCGGCHVNVHKLARRLSILPFQLKTLSFALQLIEPQ